MREFWSHALDREFIILRRMPMTYGGVHNYRIYFEKGNILFENRKILLQTVRRDRKHGEWSVVATHLTGNLLSFVECWWHMEGSRTTGSILKIGKFCCRQRDVTGNMANDLSKPCAWQEIDWMSINAAIKVEKTFSFSIVKKPQQVWRYREIHCW